MNCRSLPLALMPLLAIGCSGPLDGLSGRSSGAAGNVPEGVAAIAAPYQDLRTARVRPEDGCYWYSHAGPVETTLLPLRTVDGRPICAVTEA